MNYYNEFDASAAQWLRNLIDAKLIPEGDIDERSITEVAPSDLRGYTQCHFFAGIGGWAYALRLAGWSDNKPVWTGSCPCQPYSVAGKGLGDADDRNLWPVFFDLIRQCRPVRVFGEQVASAIGHGWLDRVRADVEKEGYACGAAVLGAHSVGAPHIRQRLYWVADSGQQGLEGYRRHVAHGDEPGRINTQATGPATKSSSDIGVVHADGIGRHQRGVPAASSGYWGSFNTTSCADGKTRRVPTEPAFQPLGHGIPSRVVRLCGYGNAIVPQVAAEFVQAAGRCLDETPHP